MVTPAGYDLTPWMSPEDFAAVMTWGVMVGERYKDMRNVVEGERRVRREW